MIVVDTSVWVDYLNGVSTLQTDWLDVEVGRQPLALTDLVLCEVLQGVCNEREAERIHRVLLEFTVFETGGCALAIAAARNYRALRARGRTVRKTMDCLIGTFCLLNGHALLHRDRDFDPFEELLGLRVVHP